MMLYAAGGAMCVVRHRDVAFALTRAPALALLISFPFLSLIWSINPEETFERSIAVVGSSLLAVYIGASFSRDSIIRLLASAHLVIALINLVVILAIPAIGVTQEEEWRGAWRGVHGHKNGLGGTAAVGILALFFALFVTSGYRRGLMAVGLLLNLVFVAVSESLTSQLAVMLGAAALIAGRGTTWPRTYLAALILLGVGALYSFLVVTEFGIQSMMGPLGRSSTMSNRLPLWAELLPTLEKSPLLGYGYAAFWGTKSTDLARIASNLQFAPHYSHNGFIELALDGGVVLVCLALAVLLSSILRALWLIEPARITSYFALTFLIGFVLSNVSESTILTRNNLIWIEFVVLSVSSALAVHLKILSRRGH